MSRVEVKPDLLPWARERAGPITDALAPRFPKIEEWESGEQLTLKELRGFAKASLGITA